MTESMHESPPEGLLAESIELERRLLGGVLEDLPGGERHLVDLTEAHFAGIRHRHIYRAIMNCAARGAMHLHLIAQQLTSEVAEPEYDRARAMRDLLDLMLKSPGIYTCHFGPVVADYAVKRAEAEVGYALAAGLIDGQTAITRLDKVSQELAVQDQIVRQGFLSLEVNEPVYHDPARLVQAGALTLLYGRGGSGKSMLVTDLAVRCAVAGKTVLMLCFEGASATVRRMQSRLAVIPADAAAAADGNLYHVSHGADNPEGFARWHGRFAARETTPGQLQKEVSLPDGSLPDVLIVDSFVTAYGQDLTDGGGDDHNSVSSVLANLRALASVTNTGVVILHHESSKGKGNGPLGSSAFMTVPDNVLHITGSPQDSWTLADEKRREGDLLRAWDVMLDAGLPEGDGPQFVVDLETTDLATARRREVQERREARQQELEAVVLALVDGKRHRQGIIDDAGQTRSDIHATLKRLIEEGVLACEGHGKPVTLARDNDSSDRQEPLVGL